MNREPSFSLVDTLAEEELSILESSPPPPPPMPKQSPIVHRVSQSSSSLDDDYLEQRKMEFDLKLLAMLNNHNKVNVIHISDDASTVSDVSFVEDDDATKATEIHANNVHKQTVEYEMIMSDDTIASFHVPMEQLDEIISSDMPFTQDPFALDISDDNAMDDDTPAIIMNLSDMDVDDWVFAHVARHVHAHWTDCGDGNDDDGNDNDDDVSSISSATHQSTLDCPILF